MAAAAVAAVFRIADIAVLGLAGLLPGCAEVVFSNAAQAVLPALVPPELLARANGSQQVSLTVGETFLGPPAGLPCGLSLLAAVPLLLTAERPVPGQPSVNPSAEGG